MGMMQAEGRKAGCCLRFFQIELKQKKQKNFWQQQYQFLYYGILKVDDNKLTPMLKQYYAVKEKYPDKPFFFTGWAIFMKHF